MLFLQCLLYDFRLFLLQVVIFREVVIENGSIQILILGKCIYGIVTFSNDVVVQPFFKVACTVSLLR